MKPSYYWLLLIGCLILTDLIAQELPRFHEVGGIVVVEIESTTSNWDAWELQTNRAGFTGTGYLNYRGNDLFNDPGNFPMHYEIAINKTGKYRFQWRSLIAQGDSNTEHNDSWLRCRDASNFYAEKPGERVYPHGSGQSPNPEGSGSNGWFKVYQNNPDGWTWATRTSDRDPHEIYMEFDTAGVYTIEIAARSQGHAIDRFVLYHEDVNSSTALDTSRPESENSLSTNTRNIERLPLKIYPTMAQDAVNIKLPTSTKLPLNLQIFATNGQLVANLNSSSISSTLNIPIQYLPNGLYHIYIQQSAVSYHAKFIKQ
ncbi:MAG: T9SS type A sorting domain-containing protein [Saprospiraceae bacterium]